MSGKHFHWIGILFAALLLLACSSETDSRHTGTETGNPVIIGSVKPLAVALARGQATIDSSWLVVLLQDSAGRSWPLDSVYTNAQFRFEPSCPGSYAISIRNPDGGAIVRSIQVASDDTVDLGTISTVAWQEYATYPNACCTQGVEAQVYGNGFLAIAGLRLKMLDEPGVASVGVLDSLGQWGLYEPLPGFLFATLVSEDGATTAPNMVLYMWNAVNVLPIQKLTDTAQSHWTFRDSSSADAGDSLVITRWGSGFVGVEYRGGLVVANLPALAWDPIVSVLRGASYLANDSIAREAQISVGTSLVLRDRAPVDTAWRRSGGWLLAD